MSQEIATDILTSSTTWMNENLPELGLDQE
jgi:hypothetical protein